MTAVITDDRAPSARRHRRGRLAARAGLAAAFVTWTAVVPGACRSGDGGAVDPTAEGRDGPTPGAVPTLAGGVELGDLDPATVLVGAELSFGSPLPSEQVAADALVTGVEIRAALARRAYATADGRHVADVAVLVLDGTRIFDEAVLGAFIEGAVAAAGGDVAMETTLAGTTVLRSTDRSGGAALGFREENLLVLVTSASEADAELTVTRQLEARARGEVGTVTPVTPLVAVPIEAVFVPVPTVTFAPIPPPEEEPAPAAPTVPAMVGAAGRYGVVAGERRTLVWALATDPGAYPSAEALEPVMLDLVAGRAEGTPPTTTEIGGRVLHSSVNEPGRPSAHVFRHGNLVVLVEGVHPDQLDAVSSAWIAALGPA